jgi:hypothetical protein
VFGEAPGQPPYTSEYEALPNGGCVVKPGTLRPMTQAEIDALY